MTVFHMLARISLIAALAMGAGCVFQPLHGSSDAAGEYGSSLSQIWVEEVDTRVAQEVRNHLIFLLQGGNDNSKARYLARLRVIDASREYAAVKGIRDQTAGSVTVFVSYDLVDRMDDRVVAEGRRMAQASYDRTPQSFANSRALRDARDRAAREAAEKLRLAFAADLAR